MNEKLLWLTARAVFLWEKYAEKGEMYSSKSNITAIHYVFWLNMKKLTPFSHVSFYSHSTFTPY